MMKPIVLAMILCDHYYRDSHTGKSIISGTFSAIEKLQFPAKDGNCAIYLALTDVASDGEVQIIFKKDTEEFEMKLPPWNVISPEDRHAVIEIGGNINGLPLPSPGLYEFIIHWNGSEIASRRLKATQLNVESDDEDISPFSPDDDYQQ